jgi:tubby-related protein 1
LSILQLNRPVKVEQHLDFKIVRIQSKKPTFILNTMDNRRILTAKKGLSSNYRICNALLEKVGKVTSNALGIEFKVFDYSQGKQQMALVSYHLNLAGTIEPRKMSLLIPCLDGNRPSKDHLLLHNKVPQWNEETQSYVLNFNGNVTQASVKNFQIVHDQDLEHICLQFGRTGENEFSMTVRYPFNIVQAFGVILTSFDSKIACE